MNQSLTELFESCSPPNKGQHRASHEYPFVGIDGEGFTLDNGYHAYFMLRIGDEYIIPEDGNVRLTTRDCLDFISRQDPHKLYVGYFFDYDVTKILEDLPTRSLSRLMNRRSRTGKNGKLYPIEYRDFEVEYLPHKEFMVRRKLSQVDGVQKYTPWVIVSDVGPFFQTAFLKAIKAWNVGTEQEWAEIEHGKNLRSEFSKDILEDIEHYNALEIKLLQELMNKFRDACTKVKLVPYRWQGPGKLAEAMFRRFGVAASKDVPLLNDEQYSDLMTFARNAFYGGRSEIAVVGQIDSPVYQYDINSAYPWAMTVVPCLTHGKWDYIPYDRRDLIPTGDVPRNIRGERFGLYYGYFVRSGKPTYWYGLPLRGKDGNISFPASGRGWYWSFEIASSTHQTFVAEDAWIYIRTCDCQPLGFVENMYKERQKLGKDGPGIVLKLALNSLYGKTVQSIGKPRYANPIWGSFITAYTRMMINNFIHSGVSCRTGTYCGSEILMVATDSVATTGLRRAKEYTEYERELGGWSKELHPKGMFLVQPGLYFGTSGKEAKTRGLPKSVATEYEEDFRRAYQRMVERDDVSAGIVVIPQTLFVGIRYAIHRKNLKLLGQWIPLGELGHEGKVVSFDWKGKRAKTADNEGSFLHLFPYTGAPDIVSLPYSKDIGGLLAKDAERLLQDGQPDWVEGGAYVAD